MKLFLTAVISTFLLISSIHAQTPALEKENWVEKPRLQKTVAKYQNEPAYLVLDSRKIEFYDDAKGEVRRYFTLHRIVHINNDKGIEYFNKVYISMRDTSDAFNIHARTILPDGKIIDVDTRDIKVVREDDGSLYKIFAIEGLEKGSDVEYIYSMIQSENYFGNIPLQGKIPVVESYFDLIYPKRLIFDTKQDNFSDAPQKDSLPNGKSLTRYHLSNIEGADEEKYSSYQVNLKRVEFKLSYNNATHPGERLFTWNGLAKKAFPIYSNCSEKEEKRVADLVDNLGWSQLKDEPAKIMAVENFLKDNYTFRKDLEAENAQNLEVILKSKVADEVGLVRLFGAVFRKLGINFQYVLCADREDVLIDKSLENWNSCDFLMFYFPAENKYIVPSKAAFRYPWIYPSWGGANGLFCKNITIGNMTTAMGEVKLIPLEDYQKTYNNTEIKLKVNTSMDSVQFDANYIYGGYIGCLYRNIFDFLTPEEEHNTLKEVIKQNSGSDAIVSSEILNRKFEDANTFKPFIIHTIVNSGDLLEKAGNKLLLKMGLVIGPQVEMYQEKERQFPIYVGYGHIEERKIVFTIPDGYTIKNLNDLKISQVYKEGGEQTMGFVSDYELNGNQLSIKIVEDYRKAQYPISQYEDFKRIINTSSDFNKVVLILEKK